uniref:Uncharacterized protein n=1 Tax=Anguilla anguilla TaxID=7936 RepID=A0A0E9Q195_ANGAN
MATRQGMCMWTCVLRRRWIRPYERIRTI